MDLNKLDEPFEPEDIEWRIQRSGESGKGAWAFVLAYVTNRAIQKRLDEVCGKDGWTNEYKPGPEGGVICGISIRCKDNNGDDCWLTKWDGAENTDVEAIKGGLSDAMKRCAVQWGIGRYLYRLEANFADCQMQTQRGKEWRMAQLKNRTKFWWKPPELPSWALPASSKPKPKAPPKSPPKSQTKPAKQKQPSLLPPEIGKGAHVYKVKLDKEGWPVLTTDGCDLDTVETVARATSGSTVKDCMMMAKVHQEAEEPTKLAILTTIGKNIHAKIIADNIPKEHLQAFLGVIQETGPLLFPGAVVSKIESAVKLRLEVIDGEES